MNTTLRLLSGAALAAGVALLTGCTSTKITSTWGDPALGVKTYTQVMVLAIEERAEVRRDIEAEFVKQLAARGVTAASSQPKFALADIDQDEAATARAMHELGMEAVLVIRLVDRKTLVRLMPDYPPDIALTPYQFDPAVPYRSWSSYYDMSYSYARTPTSPRVDEVVYLESNLYALPDGDLQWSAHTETYLQEGSNKVEKLKSFVATMLKTLAQAKAIP